MSIPFFKIFQTIFNPLLKMGRFLRSNPEKRKEERHNAVPLRLFYRLNMFLSVREKPDDPAGKHRADDQPDRRKCDKTVDDYRADASVPHKDRRHQVEIEYTVQPPVDRAEQHEDIRYKIRNKHR